MEIISSRNLESIVSQSSTLGYQIVWYGSDGMFLVLVSHCLVFETEHPCIDQVGLGLEEILLSLPLDSWEHRQTTITPVLTGNSLLRVYVCI